MIKTFLMVIFLMAEPGIEGREAFVIGEPKFTDIPNCQMYVQANIADFHEILADKYGRPKEIAQIFCVQTDRLDEFMSSQGLAPLEQPRQPSAPTTPGLST